MHFQRFKSKGPVRVICRAAREEAYCSLLNMKAVTVAARLAHSPKAWALEHESPASRVSPK